MKKMINNIDARGLACPQPVIMTKNALEKITDGRLIVVVDNNVAKENVSKLITKLGHSFTIEQKENHYYFDITVGQGSQGEGPAVIKDQDITIVITSNLFGEGDEKLGSLLIKGYIYALTETTPLISNLILINNGVKLGVEGSEALDHIKTLRDKGVKVLSCGTCLDFYNLKDKLAVGEISNMYTIVEIMNNSHKTIKI